MDDVQQLLPAGRFAPMSSDPVRMDYAMQWKPTFVSMNR